MAAIKESNFVLTSETTSKVYIENPSDMLSPWRSNPSFKIIVWAHSIIFLFGVYGNIIVLLAVRKTNKPIAPILLSLAFADLLMLLVFLPLETLEYFVITWDGFEHICKLSSYIEQLASTSTVFNLMALSVER